MSAGSEFVVDRRTNSKAAGGGMVPTVPVPMDRPAPTLTGKAGGQWVFRNGAQANATVRRLDQPAPTILGSADNGDSAWVYTSPATTVCGDPRITARCHHEEGSQGANAKTTAQVAAGDYEGTEPIKLTEEEGLILQSFRPDYPVQGTKDKRWEQIGNAVPPLMAAHALAALTGRAIDREVVDA